jgi:hypothetical protein
LLNPDSGRQTLTAVVKAVLFDDLRRQFAFGDVIQRVDFIVQRAFVKRIPGLDTQSRRVTSQKQRRRFR